MADAPRGAEGARHECLRAAVRNSQDVVRDRRGVDADVDYDRFWQRDIVSRRTWYDERTRSPKWSTSHSARGSPRRAVRSACYRASLALSDSAHFRLFFAICRFESSRSAWFNATVASSHRFMPRFAAATLL